MNPTSWNLSDVKAWPWQAGLSESIISVLRENEIDGPMLLALEKEELHSEVGIASLPAQRYLWDLILTLQSHQDFSDCATAINALKAEIDLLQVQGFVDALAGGGIGTDEEVMNQLQSNAG